MFLRFGEIPKDERSHISYRSYDCGYENGVSVFECTDDYRIILPSKIPEGVLADITNFLFYSHKNVYIVEGDVVGIGYDNEPLLKNVKVIKDITKEYYEMIKVDERKLHDELIKRAEERGFRTKG